MISIDLMLSIPMRWRFTFLQARMSSSRKIISFKRRKEIDGG